MIVTSGPTQNSYLDLATANAILLTCATSFMDIGEQLDTLDEPYLLEAARDLESLWAWQGQPSDYNQALAWPRRYVTKPGFQMPCEPGWSAPWSQDAALEFKIDYLTPGLSAVPLLDPTVVPQQILEAQALLAMFRKKGGSLIGDTKNDAQGLQLDTSFKIAYVNPVRAAGDINKRLAGLGLYLGDSLLRTRHG